MPITEEGQVRMETKTGYNLSPSNGLLEKIALQNDKSKHSLSTIL